MSAEINYSYGLIPYWINWGDDYGNRSAWDRHLPPARIVVGVAHDRRQLRLENDSDRQQDEERQPDETGAGDSFTGEHMGTDQ